MSHTTAPTTLRTAICLACILAAVSAVAAPAQDLRLNAPIERTLSGQEEDSYTIRLEKKQRLKAVAEQKGVDVVVQILSPKGEVLATIDGPTGDQGPETIEWIAAEAGVYRIVVKPLEANTKPGKYEIRLLEVRKATRAELENVRTNQDVKEAEKEWFAARFRGDEAALRVLAATDYARVFPSGPPVTLDQVIHQIQELRKRDPGVLRSLEPDLIDVRPYGDTALVSGHTVGTNVRNGREFHVPSQFVHLWRRQDGKWRLSAEEVFPAAPIPQTHPVVSLSDERMRGCVGRFQHPGGTVLVVENAGDHLVVRPETSSTDLKWELYPENEAEFFTKDDVASVTFVRDVQGKVIHALFIAGGQAARLTPLP